GVGLVTLAGGQRPAVRVKLNAQAIAPPGLTRETGGPPIPRPPLNPDRRSRPRAAGHHGQRLLPGDCQNADVGRN
ncbi:hypothetical protein M8371_27925, partial [Klebsiella pneumoniae]|nr:hypothetical protein [Klebsiella pneumoniae]